MQGKVRGLVQGTMLGTRQGTWQGIVKGTVIHTVHGVVIDALEAWYFPIIFHRYDEAMATELPKHFPRYLPWHEQGPRTAILCLLISEMNFE